MVSQMASILVVDDEKPVCKLLCDDLTGQGYSCAIALTGEEALTKLADETFDLALLDIRLPGISGIEVLRIIRSDCHNIAAIMITAIKDVDTAVESMKLGASDYIVKPFNLDRIDATVRTVLENQKCSQRGQDYQPPLSARHEGCYKQGVTESFRQMDAVARGVEARVEKESGYTKVVIERTTRIAFHLGISEEEIREWATARLNIYSDRNEQIKASLDKLRQSPLAQIWLGITEAQLLEQNPENLEGYDQTSFLE